MDNLLHQNQCVANLCLIIKYLRRSSGIGEGNFREGEKVTSLVNRYSSELKCRHPRKRKTFERELKQSHTYIFIFVYDLDSIQSERGREATDRGQHRNLCNRGEKETKCFTGEKEIST